MDLAALFYRRCWRKQIIPKFLFILIYFADFSGFACLIGVGPISSRASIEKGRAWNDERLPILKKRK
jgi:hypothetical protein